MHRRIRIVGNYYTSFYDEDNNKLFEIETENFNNALKVGHDGLDDNLNYYSFRIDRAMFNSIKNNFKWDYEA